MYVEILYIDIIKGAPIYPILRVTQSVYKVSFSSFRLQTVLFN